MSGLTEGRLAERAGVSVEHVRELVEAGVLRPRGEAEAAFVDADLRRVRLADACIRAGLPLEGLAEAIAAGKLSFAFLDLPQYEWTGAQLSDRTFGQACAQLGISFELVRRTQEALGLPPPEREDELVREDDLGLFPSLAISSSFGMPEEAIVRAARVYGDALRRVAQAEANVYRRYLQEPMLASGMDVGQMLEATSAFGDQYLAVMDSTLLAMYHRQQEHSWLENMVENIEGALEELGLHRRLPRPPAMAFLDLAGYTRLTEEQGDQAAAELAANLAGIVQASSQRHGGRPVKWLGDGVMLWFSDPGEAVVAALEAVERVPGAGLPPAHVGIAAGPVVHQDGDYFGRTVNLAARISATAGPSEVLVTSDVVEAASAAGIRFEAIGSVELKGFDAPAVLHRAAAAR